MMGKLKKAQEKVKVTKERLKIYCFELMKNQMTIKVKGITLPANRAC